jgi:hypothetical protein
LRKNNNFLNIFFYKINIGEKSIDFFVDFLQGEKIISREKSRRKTPVKLQKVAIKFHFLHLNQKSEFWGFDQIGFTEILPTGGAREQIIGKFCDKKLKF